MDKRRMCPNCRAFITTDDKVCPYCQFTVGPKAVDRRTPADALGGWIPHARFTTMMILLINTGLYIAMVIHTQASGQGASLDFDGKTLVEFGAKYGPFMMQGEWWRLVTAGFLHGGLFHILMNSWVLYDLGAQVEEVYGSSRMLVIYFVSTVCGFYLSAVWSGAVSVGASAALMGLIGAMIALGVRHRSELGNQIRGTYMRWAIYIILFGLLPGFNVDNAAHIGGLAAGFGMAWVTGTPRWEGSTTEKVWRGVSWLCIFLTAASFLKWYLWFSRMTQ